jgi:hypothetical protein
VRPVTLESAIAAAARMGLRNPYLPSVPSAMERHASTIYLQSYDAAEGAQASRGVDYWVCLAG